MDSNYESANRAMAEERREQRENAMNVIIKSKECMEVVNKPFKKQNNNIKTVEEMKKVEDEMALVPEWAKNSLHREAIWMLRQKVHETTCEVCSSTERDEFGDIPICDLAFDNMELFRSF